MKRVIRAALILICTAVFFISGFNLIKISGGYLREAKVKDSLSSYRPSAPDDARLAAASERSDSPAAQPAGESPQNGNQPDEPDDIIVNQNIIDLRNDVNSGTAGWISIPGTHIDYPFVRTDDNEFYVSHDIYGNSSPAGTLFMDMRCAGDLSDFNTIIYGHNMKNNTMFGDLPLFADEWFFNTTPSGTLHTEYGSFRLEVFAYMVVRGSDGIVYDPAAGSGVYMEYAKENARCYREPGETERVVTLSTCGYEFDGARIVVLAALRPLATSH